MGPGSITGGIRTSTVPLKPAVPLKLAETGNGWWQPAGANSSSAAAIIGAPGILHPGRCDDSVCMGIILAKADAALSSWGGCAPRHLLLHRTAGGKTCQRNRYD